MEFELGAGLFQNGQVFKLILPFMKEFTLISKVRCPLDIQLKAGLTTLCLN